MTRMLNALKQIEAESVVVESTPVVPLAPPPAEEPDSHERQVGQPVGPASQVHDWHFRDLAERVLLRLPPAVPSEQGRAALLFVGAESSRPEPGMLLSLAGTLADQTAGEVLLVDCDFRRAELANLAAVATPPNRGLAEVLAGEAAWREVVADTATEGVSVLPGTRLPEDASWKRLEKTDPSALVGELRDSYPLVLLAGAQPSDPLVARLAACCHGTYLLVRLGETSRRTAGRAIRTVQSYGGRVLGCIVITDKD